MTNRSQGGEVQPLILFDGVCDLCNASVLWVIKRDPDARFRFGTLQSEVARVLLAEMSPSLDIDALPDSIVLIDAGGVHTRSTAAIRIARELGFPYTMLRFCSVVPRPIRDAVYRFVARNRYRWFGKRDVCMVPTPELEARFLDPVVPPR